ncbi:MAG: 37S ribosomal protein S23 mitochondrial [Pycnora praestabilis]|nr:MAG: 37S ribosomal protein S23 mitochondrial [Pycnora praestabilis]
MAISPHGLSSSPSFLIPSCAAPFSTSPSLEAAAKGKGGPQLKRGQLPGSGPPGRGVKSLRIKKKVVVKSGRPPAPGERKALRKRIVLSNTNALEVKGMEDLDKETMVDHNSRCQTLGLPGPVVDQLRAVEAFKTTQGWGMFRRPGMLMRNESIEIGKILQSIDTEDKGRTVRKVFTGNMGNGKSMMMLQSMAMAFVRGWIVISIPEGQDLTIGHTEYSPLPNTKPPQYVQKTYTAQFLSQIFKANQPILSTLRLSQKHDLPIPLQSNISLDRLADLGARDPDIAWPVFEALWAELTALTTVQHNRPPLLLALDGLSHAMRVTAYRAADSSFIHAHDLVLIRHFLTYLSGTKTLPNGGAILAATSGSNNPSTPSLTLALRQQEARAAGNTDIPQASPFETIDQRVMDSLKNVEVSRLKGLSREEARGLMEYYAASGVLRQTVNEQLISEKWTLAGGGIVGELERSTVRMSL